MTLVAESPVIESVELPDGRLLVVRAAVVEDIDALLALYEALTPLDRQRRFFSSFRPDRPFVEHLVAARERGGACLVAEVTDREADEGGELVAEADFELLPDGDAELSIIVSSGWRGWLAPFLLDVLVREAARRGIPNLQAEILTTNRPMLALAQARGHATLDHEDWSTVRVSLATAGRVPSWPGGHERPRVLVEIPGGHWHGTGALHDLGIDVMACPGPGRQQSRCPLIEGRPCPLVEGADVVVFALRPEDPGAEELLAAHEQTAQRRPLVVEVRGTDLPPEHEPEGAVELRRPTPEQIAEVLGALLGVDPPAPPARAR